MNIVVWDARFGEDQHSASALAEMAGQPFPISERVPEAAGTAFDVYSWYEGWLISKGAENKTEPTYMRVEAADEFEAVIPWNQLGQAAFVYELEGRPLVKGFPIRLYVPDGSSACLNVKSVVRVELHSAEPMGEEATYGFKNRISVDDLRKI